ncbi:hypothetical protein ISCGN_014752 [Ixodes scapularis]
MSELTPEELRKRRLARLAGTVSDAPAVRGSRAPEEEGAPEEAAGAAACSRSEPWESPHQDPCKRPKAQPETAPDSSATAKACPMESESGDVHMQTVDTDNDSCEKSFLSQLDVDSGIENMEVDELERRDSIKHRESKETVEEQVQACLGRVFQARWCPNVATPLEAVAVALPQTEAACFQLQSGRTFPFPPRSWGGLSTAALRAMAKSLALEASTGVWHIRPNPAVQVPSLHSFRKVVDSKDTRLREAGVEAVYCLARGAPKGPNIPRAQLNHQGPLFPGHGKAVVPQRFGVVTLSKG